MIKLATIRQMKKSRKIENIKGIQEYEKQRKGK